MWTCPSCQAQTPADYDICIQCRAPLLRADLIRAQVIQETDSVPPPALESVPPLPASDSVPPPPIFAGISASNRVQGQISFMPKDSLPPLAPPIPQPTRMVTANKTANKGRMLYVRKKELRAIEKLYKQSVENNRFGGVVVTGQPGMGVSTLLKMAASRVAVSLPRSRIHYVVSRELNDPFFPFSRLLRRVFETEDATDANALRGSIASKVGQMLENTPESIIAETTHLLGFMSGVPFSKSTVLKSLLGDPELMHQKLKEALLRFFYVNLKDQPRVLFFDEAHKLPMTSRGGRLFLEIVNELQNVPFIVICGGGPETAGLMRGDNVLPVTLAPLTRKVMRDLFSSFMPKLANPPEDLVEKTIAQAKGNPGALSERCALLRESGVVNTEDDEWTVDIGQLSRIPSDQHDTLKARLDQIEPRDRQVLQTAALFGEVFWDEAIVAMSRLTVRLKKNITPGQIWADDSDALAIASTLERLVERRFLVPLSDRDIRGTIKYAFAGSGIREKIISTIDRKRQKQYHLLAAEWLSHTASKFGPFLSELESNHWVKGGEQYKAAMSCFRAARQASSLYLNQKSTELFHKGLELLGPEDWVARIDALHDLSTLYELQNNLQEAEQCLTEMLRNAWIIAHRGKAGAALNKIGRLYRARGDSVAARAFINRGLALFRATGDDAGVAACLGDLGELARQAGQLDRAYGLVKEAFEIQRKQRNKRSMAVSLQSLGSIEADRTSYEKAERFFTEAMELRRRINDRGGMAQSLVALATVKFNRGDTEGAMAPFTSALDLALEVGDRRTEAAARCKLGQALRERSMYKEAMQHVKACEEIATVQNDDRLLAEVLSNMSLLSLKMGELEAGRQQAENALSLVAHQDAKETEGLAYRALGEIESTTMWDTSTPDSEDKASAAFSRALDAFRATGNELEIAHTLYAMGNRMLERGDMAGSLRCLTEAGEIFKRIESPLSKRIERTIRETTDQIPDDNIGMLERMRRGRKARKES